MLAGVAGVVRLHGELSAALQQWPVSDHHISSSRAPLSLTCRIATHSLAASVMMTAGRTGPWPQVGSPVTQA